MRLSIVVRGGRYFVMLHGPQTKTCFSKVKNFLQTHNPRTYVPQTSIALFGVSPSRSPKNEQRLGGWRRFCSTNVALGRAPPGRSLNEGDLEVPTGKIYLCACLCPRVLYTHTTLPTWLLKAPDTFIPEIFFTTLISVSLTVAILLKKTWILNLLD